MSWIDWVLGFIYGFLERLQQRECEVSPFVYKTYVRLNPSKMDPSMDTIPHISLDCQQEDNAEVSLPDRRSSFQNESSSSNSSIIHIQDLNPSQDW